jgi:hypothetical protein
MFVLNYNCSASLYVVLQLVSFCGLEVLERYKSWKLKVGDLNIETHSVCPCVC